MPDPSYTRAADGRTNDGAARMSSLKPLRMLLAARWWTYWRQSRFAERHAPWRRVWVIESLSRLSYWMNGLEVIPFADWMGAGRFAPVTWTGNEASGDVGFDGPECPTGAAISVRTTATLSAGASVCG